MSKAQRVYSSLKTIDRDWNITITITETITIEKRGRSPYKLERNTKLDQVKATPATGAESGPETEPKTILKAT